MEDRDQVRLDKLEQIVEIQTKLIKNLSEQVKFQNQMIAELFKNKMDK